MFNKMYREFQIILCTQLASSNFIKRNGLEDLYYTQQNAINLSTKVNVFNKSDTLKALKLFRYVPYKTSLYFHFMHYIYFITGN